MSLTISQPSGAGTGTEGEAFPGAWVDQAVTLTLSPGVDAYEHTLLWRPAGSAAAISDASAQVASFAPDVGNRSYLVRCREKIAGVWFSYEKVIRVTKDAAGLETGLGLCAPAKGETPDAGNVGSDLGGYVSLYASNLDVIAQAIEESALASDVTALSGDVAALSGDLAALSGDVTALSGDVTAVADDLSAAVTSLGSDIAAAQAAASAAHYRPWGDKLIALTGNCDPGQLMREIQRGGNNGATPTFISTTVARCALFIPPRTITINRIRAFGLNTTTNAYRVAIYRYSDLARLTSELAFSTAANTWANIGSALNVTLAKDVPYFVAVGVNATGSSPGLACYGANITSTTGQVTTAPGSLPGNMAANLGYLDHYHFQFTTSSGALPSTAATLAAQAAWSGGMPAFWADAADT